MATDPFAEFKIKQKEGWAYFAPTDIHTTAPAAQLVRFAQVRSGQSVLDVGTGTGVVALTARRALARVTGLDLTPELLARAKEHAAIAELEDIKWQQGDAEQLPFEDASFDVVLSQFGHMFAPRPAVAVSEMLRVLKPGGRIAFATWPPEHLVGRIFMLVSKHMPPPPGVASPAEWGDPKMVRERLAEGVADVFFERAVMLFPALSLQHYRHAMEKTVGPVLKLTQSLQAQADKLQAFRKELEQLVSQYYQHNLVHQDYLLTRATKRA